MSGLGYLVRTESAYVIRFIGSNCGLRDNIFDVCGNVVLQMSNENSVTTRKCESNTSLP